MEMVLACGRSLHACGDAVGASCATRAASVSQPSRMDLCQACSKTCPLQRASPSS